MVGWLGEVMVIFPPMMSCFTWSNSVLSDAGTVASKLWNGASPVPLLASVPM